MTFPVADSTYNPKVEVKEEDSRVFNEAGVLIGGGVRVVTYVDGKEFNPQTLDEIDAEQQRTEGLVTTEGLTPPPMNVMGTPETPEGDDGPGLVGMSDQAEDLVNKPLETSDPVAQ